MIDWTLVQKESPDAFADFLRWYKSLGTQWHFSNITELGMLRFDSGEGLAYETMFFNERDLYDYFDKIGIIVSVIYDTAFLPKICYQKPEGIYSGIVGRFKTRTEAETEAFT